MAGAARDGSNSDVVCLALGLLAASHCPAHVLAPRPRCFQVQSVHDIAAATEGEVTLASLGPAFAEELLADEEEAAAAAVAAGGSAADAGSGGSP